MVKYPIAAVYPTKKNESLDQEQWNSFWQVWNVVGVGKGFLRGLCNKHPALAAHIGEQ